MIGFLEGKPKVFNTKLLILCGGVGYEVSTTTQTLSWATQEETISLFIYTHVKEEALQLYGFRSQSEKNMFTTILGVSGVGPSIALSMLNHSPEAIVAAVQQADTHFFSQIPRVGKKLAQKIIIELRSKLGEIKSLDLSPKSQQYQEVLESLVGLGFERQAVQTQLDAMDLEVVEVDQAIKSIITNIRNK